MSDLQLILIFLGVLIVLGVLLFNWWQEKKFKQKIASQFKQPTRDVLVPDGSTPDGSMPNASTYDAPANQASITRNSVTSGGEQSAAFEGEMHDSSTLNIPTNTLNNEKPEPYFELPETEFASYDVLEGENRDGLMFETDDTILNDDAQTIKAIDDIHQTQPVEELNAPLQSSENDTMLAATTQDDSLLPESLLPQIDLIAVLYASIPTKANALLPFAAQLHEVHPNFMLQGLSLSDDWLDLRHHSGDEVISKIICSQQLADRSGPVSRQVLNRFQHAVETMGLDLNCHVEWQSKADPANTATELDQFCMEVDQTIGFHLIGNDNARFHGTKLRGLAESQGFVLADDGKFYQTATVADFYMVNGDGQAFTVESLKNITIGKVSFQLEIPTCKNAVERFDQMVRVARQFATALDASVVDDATKPLNDIHLEKIRQQLRVIHAKMVARGVVPGSTHALRLFA